MSTPTSNVSVVSNVYPVTTVRIRTLIGLPTCLEGVCDDSLFRNQIKGKPALKKLSQEKCGTSAYERDERQNLIDAHLVAKWQIKAYWDEEGSGQCIECKPKERPFGVVRGKFGYEVVNRCENPRCRCRPEQGKIS
jgi:hypothetical protein